MPIYLRAISFILGRLQCHKNTAGGGTAAGNHYSALTPGSPSVTKRRITLLSTRRNTGASWNHGETCGKPLADLSTRSQGRTQVAPHDLLLVIRHYRKTLMYGWNALKWETVVRLIVIRLSACGRHKVSHGWIMLERLRCCTKTIRHSLRLYIIHIPECLPPGGSDAWQ
jgi:hypothetical protein